MRWTASLAARIFLASILLVVVVLGVAFGLTSGSANRAADESMHRALANTRRAVANFLAARSHALAGMGAVSAGVPQFRERLLASDRANVLDRAREYRDLIGVSWVLVTNADGILVARTDYPDQFDRDLSRGALIGSALSGDRPGGAWLDDVAHKLFVAVATPLQASREASPQGVLVTAFELDDSLAQAIRQATNTDVVFFALDTLERPYVVASTLPRDQIAPALAADTAAVRTLVHDTAGTELTARVSDERLVGLAEPIRSAGGDVYGGFVAFRSRDAELAAFRALRRALVIALGLGVLLALTIALVLGRQTP